MQNYEQILQELGIEVPEDKKADLKKKIGENYKTIADYNKVVEKRDEYKASLDDVQGKLDGFQNVDVDNLKSQIATLTQDLANEKADRQKEATRRTLETTVDEFLSERGEDGKPLRKFVNAITENSIRESLLKELESDSAKGVSVEKIFKKLITDKDGNEIPDILVNPHEENRARFTTAAKPGSGAKVGAMTREQIEAIPNKAERQRAIAEHISLFK